LIHLKNVALISNNIEALLKLKCWLIKSIFIKLFFRVELIVQFVAGEVLHIFWSMVNSDLKKSSLEETAFGCKVDVSRLAVGKYYTLKCLISFFLKITQMFKILEVCDGKIDSRVNEFTFTII
jgi:hypothetical protein